MTPNRLPIWKSAVVGGAMLMALFLPAAPPAAGPPTVVIDDLTQVEGTGGTNLMVFTVRLTGTSNQQTVVNYSTGDDPGGLHPAKAGGACGSDTEDGSDFFSLTSAVTIPADTVNPPSATIPIVTCGDGRDEFDETFAVNLTSSFPLNISDPQAIGTIVDDDPLPTLSIAGATLFERNTGTSTASLTVTLSPASGKTVTAQPILSNGTAHGDISCTNGPDVDFVNLQPGLVQFAPGQTTATVDVPVCGDVNVEADQTFFVDLTTDESRATIRSNHARVTIRDDDTPPVISIGNARTAEGNIGFLPRFSHNLPFTVTLSRPFGRDVNVHFTTANDTAKGGGPLCPSILHPDYLSVTTPGTLRIPAYETHGNLNIPVCHDGLFEPDETFFVDITSTDGTIGVGRGTGTIRNDDLPSGTFALTPQNATVGTGESITYTLTWTVPDPRVWRDLSTIDLRLIDDRANAIWLRWDEAANTFQLLNAREHLHGPSGHPGEPVRLTGNLATLDLEHSSVVGSGPTGRDVTLTLRLGLKRPASGHTFRVEVAGADDLGHRDALLQAGTLVVK